jgi:ketosteroid isomerase-like protein
MSVTKLTADQKAAIVRDVYDRLNRGDFDALDEVFVDDAAWHGFVAGDVRGKAAIKGVLRRMAELNAKFKLHDVLVGDDHSVSLHEMTLTKGDTTATARQAIVTHITDDGKIIELWTMGNPQDVAAFLPPRA